MKKKIITLALATVMTFAFSITAAAAPSPKATVVNDSTGTAVTVTSLTPGITASAEVTVAEATLNELKSNVVVAASAAGATVEKSFAFELNGGVPADRTITVSVAGFGVKPGDAVWAYHFVDGGVKMESVSVTGNDQVTFTGLTSCSPFVLVKINPNVATAAAASTASGVAKSPKTGLSVDAVLAAIADLF